MKILPCLSPDLSSLKEIESGRSEIRIKGKGGCEAFPLHDKEADVIDKAEPPF